MAEQGPSEGETDDSQKEIVQKKLFLKPHSFIKITKSRPNVLLVEIYSP